MFSLTLCSKMIVTNCAESYLSCESVVVPLIKNLVLQVSRWNRGGGCLQGPVQTTTGRLPNEQTSWYKGCHQMTQERPVTYARCVIEVIENCCYLYKLLSMIKEWFMKSLFFERLTQIQHILLCSVLKKESGLLLGKHLPVFVLLCKHSSMSIIYRFLPQYLLHVLVL